jgi:hypothetical protein
MSHMFAAPPPDTENNQRIESDPGFPRARARSRLVNAVGIGTIILPFLKFVLGDASPTGALFQALVVLGISVVPASIILVAFSRGLVWYNIRTTVPNPSPFFGIFAASVSLIVAGVTNSFVSYGQLFLWPIPVALVIWLAMIFTTNEFKSYTRLDIGNMGAILFICYLFSFGAFTNSNCVFDTKKPTVFPTTITEKKITENKQHDESYWVIFTPVAGLDDTKTQVHESFYNATEVNDTIRFNLKAGVWGMPWYYLELKEQ